MDASKHFSQTLPVFGGPAITILIRIVSSQISLERIDAKVSLWSLFRVPVILSHCHLGNLLFYVSKPQRPVSHYLGSHIADPPLGSAPPAATQRRNHSNLTALWIYRL
jgi:hypothetical protein